MGTMLWSSKLGNEGTKKAGGGESTTETESGSLMYCEMLDKSETDCSLLWGGGNKFCATSLKVGVSTVSAVILYLTNMAGRGHYAAFPFPLLRPISSHIQGLTRRLF